MGMDHELRKLPLLSPSDLGCSPAHTCLRANMGPGVDTRLDVCVCVSKALNLFFIFWLGFIGIIYICFDLILKCKTELLSSRSH